MINFSELLNLWYGRKKIELKTQREIERDDREISNNENLNASTESMIDIMKLEL